MNNARIYEIIPYVKRLIYVFSMNPTKRTNKPSNSKGKRIFPLCQCQNEENILPFFRLYVMVVEETAFYID